MEGAAEQCASGCRGACLHRVEFILGDKEAAPGDKEAAPAAPAADDEEAFCNFVCQFVSLDCPREPVCTEQPCANFALCGNKEPQWLLDCYGGLCAQPCELAYGRVFEFSAFAGDDVCPVCLEAGGASVVYECEHMVCVRCYKKAAYSDAATAALQRCPTCRGDGQPRSRPVNDEARRRSIFVRSRSEFSGM